MGKYIALSVLTCFAMMASVAEAFSQCAMCKAVAEESIDEAGYGLAMGLNIGILFIMSIPYILLAIVLLVFFKSQIKGFLESFNNIH